MITTFVNIMEALWRLFYLIHSSVASDDVQPVSTKKGLLHNRLSRQSLVLLFFFFDVKIP